MKLRSIPCSCGWWAVHRAILPDTKFELICLAGRAWGTTPGRTFEHWEPLSHRFIPRWPAAPLFHLKVIYRTLHAGL